ncbi:MAG: DUF3857 domain-containing transglutaminase family protein [Candidatus Eisenbacteria bacterium]
MRRLGMALLLLLTASAAHSSVAPPELVDPEEAIAALAGAEKDDYEGADRVVLFDRTVVEMEETGLSHRYEHKFVKVMDGDGAKELRAIRFDYDPASNIIEILAARVHRADSTYVDVDPGALVDATAPAHMIYWGGRMVVLPLPPLAPGDGLETITYKKGFQIAYLAGGEDDDERYIPPMRGHFYDVVHFQDALPMVDKTYTVHVPKDKPLQYSIYNEEVMSSLTFGAEHFVYKFWKKEVPAFIEEPRMWDAPDFVPKVVMATVADWPEKSRWFYGVNEDRDIFGADPAIEAKVREITAGLPSDDEKIAALLHWVAQNIRYSGLNMGEGEGYTLHPSIMTFRDRCGVCKDIAGMLVTMLRVAGYPTFAAMTMAGSRVEAIPADQFNHCVVALEKEDGSYLMLDPTWAPWYNTLWSRWEGEQHYVIGTPEGEDLMMIPSFTAEDNLVTVKSDGVIDEAGDLTGTIVVTGKGVGDGRLRQAKADHPKRGVRPFVEEWIGAVSERAEIVDYSFTDHRDFSIDTSLRIRYRVAGYADMIGDEIAFRSPGVRFVAENERLSRLAGVPDSDDRVNGVFIYGPQRIRVDETVKLPGGYEAEAPEDIEMKEDCADADISWTATGNKLVLSGTWALLDRQFDIDGYEGVMKVQHEIEKAADTDCRAAK